MRLTKEVRQNILRENEGYKEKRLFKGKNYQQEDTYMIHNQRLLITTRARIIYSNKEIKKRRYADEIKTKKFIKKYLNRLKI